VPGIHPLRAGVVGVVEVEAADAGAMVASALETGAGREVGAGCEGMECSPLKLCAVTVLTQE
jgi:hypothetical protein